MREFSISISILDSPKPYICFNVAAKQQLIHRQTYFFRNGLLWVSFRSIDHQNVVVATHSKHINIKYLLLLLLLDWWWWWWLRWFLFRFVIFFLARFQKSIRSRFWQWLRLIPWFVVRIFSFFVHYLFYSLLFSFVI